MNTIAMDIESRDSRRIHNRDNKCRCLFSKLAAQTGAYNQWMPIFMGCHINACETKRVVFEIGIKLTAGAVRSRTLERRPMDGGSYGRLCGGPGRQAANRQL